MFGATCLAFMRLGDNELLYEQYITVNRSSNFLVSHAGVTVSHNTTVVIVLGRLIAQFRLIVELEL